jgi:trans-aconitate methyltransferase
LANASLQWIPDHKTLVQKLFQQVCPKGVFADQIPTELHLGFLNDILEGIKADYPAQSMMT